MNILVDREIELGGEKYQIKPSLRKSFALTKYRNKNSLGIEVTTENKSALEKIITLLGKSEKGEISDEDFYNQLTTDEKLILAEMTKKTSREFSLDECLEIISVALDVELIKANEIVESEFNETSFDILQTKVQTILNLVFMSAKDTSKPKA